MDEVNESNPSIVIQGDFNIDLLKPRPTCTSTTSFVWPAPTNNIDNRYKRHSLTRVKLTDLYKQLGKNHIYIHFNKQNLDYGILP